MINGKTNSIVATATVGVEPLGIATDPATRNVYAVNIADGTMSILHDSCTPRAVMIARRRVKPR